MTSRATICCRLYVHTHTHQKLVPGRQKAVRQTEWGHLKLARQRGTAACTHTCIRGQKALHQSHLTSPKPTTVYIYVATWTEICEPRATRLFCVQIRCLALRFVKFFVYFTICNECHGIARAEARRPASARRSHASLY